MKRAGDILKEMPLTKKAARRPRPKPFSDKSFPLAALTPQAEHHYTQKEQLNQAH